MRSSRALAVLIVLATLAAVLPKAAMSVLPGARREIIFTVWGMPFEDRLFKDIYARDWEKLNPGLTVDQRRYTDDLLMKYNAWHSIKTGPEVMRLEITPYHGMVARGMLEPLDSYINDPQNGMSAEEMAQIPSYILDLLRVDGHIYALPEDSAQYGLFYNKADFDEYNQEHPDAPLSYPSENWTWEDLRDAAKKLTTYDSAGRIDRAGVDFSIWAWPFIGFLRQAGGELWDRPNGDVCTIDSAAGVRALAYFRALQREDRTYRFSAGYLSGTGPDALFATGRASMLFDGSWRVPNFELVAPDLDFAVSPLPRGPREGGRPAVVCGCVMWGVSAHAKEKEEGWRFLKWLISKEQAAAYWDTLRVAPPANLAVLNSPEFRSTRGVPKLDASGKPTGRYEVPPMREDKFQDRAAWLLYATRPDPKTGVVPGFVPVHPYQRELENEITAMLTEFLQETNQDTPESALRRVVQRVHSIIDRDRAAKGLPAVSR
jgi:multiple sugar transport system substrate-binding protein